MPVINVEIIRTIDEREMQKTTTTKKKKNKERREQGEQKL